MTPAIKPFVLIILDGWGYREEAQYNAIHNAHIPHWRELWQRCPHTLIEGSGQCVGLPKGQMGNSEVGHLTIGAGRVVYQELTRVDQAIADGCFEKNATFLEAIDKAISNNTAIHVMGLLSPGGVHSHENHIQALLQLAVKKGVKKVYCHAFLDGRDTPPKSALHSLQMISAIEGVHIASIIGRYYAMDRDKRWERTQQAYGALTKGKADYYAQSPEKALENAYARGETDEFVKPTIINASGFESIQAGDIVVFMNFRADRARQLTRLFLEDEHLNLSAFVSLTQYAADLPTSIAFPPQALNNSLGEYLSTLHYRQLRLAETEKYAHVTFFFNGGREAPYEGEERQLISSPKVATYDLQPEMAAPELMCALIEAIHAKKYGLIVCNFANPDMVGHTGNYPATIKAIETIDHCLGQIYQALMSVDGQAIITADHGNAECMFDEQTQQPHTAHTNELVPFIYIGKPAEIMHHDGTLSDIAPTILYCMDLLKPIEMTGKCLLKWTSKGV